MEDLWDDIEKLSARYRAFSAENIPLDLLRYNAIAVTHHSTSIEGSTLTPLETELLIKEGKTAMGKPLYDHNMVVDHFKSLQFVLAESAKMRPISEELLRDIAGMVMTNTGGPVTTVLGETDTRKGELRKGAARAGTEYFATYDKVPSMLTELVIQINKQMDSVKAQKEILELAFKAHFDLVSIHPWSDGNGRTSRLLMNYIENYYEEPLTVVFSDEKQNYISALQASRKQKNISPIVTFLAGQHKRYLKTEIELYSTQFIADKLSRSQRKDEEHPKGYSLIF